MIKKYIPTIPQKGNPLFLPGKLHAERRKKRLSHAEKFSDVQGKLFPGNKRPSTGIHRAGIRYFAPLTFPVFIKKQDGENQRAETTDGKSGEARKKLGRLAEDG